MRDQLRAAAQSEVDRWEKAIGDELLALFDRQQAVVLARLQGTKARKHTRHWEPAGTRPFEVKAIFDRDRWVKAVAGALSPVVARLYASVMAKVGASLGIDPDLDGDVVSKAIGTRIDLIAKGVATAMEAVEAYVAEAETAGTPLAEMVEHVTKMYAEKKPSWAARISGISAVGSINHAALLAAMEAGASAKQWLSCRDSKVRDTHVKADGQVRLLDERFKLGGIATHPKRSELMFPGDPGPGVPLDETMNCRCTLLFSPPRVSSTGAPRVPALAGKALPKAETCKYCDAPASKRVIWAEGKAYVPVCAEHVDKATEKVGGPNEVDAVRDIKDAQLELEAAEREVGILGAYTAAGDGDWMESKAIVRTAAGAAHYGQPIGSVIVRNLPKRGTVLGTIDRRPAVEASTDRDVWALLAKYPPAAGVPDRDTTRIIAMKDRSDRVGAYVAWDETTGDVLSVSVHPSLAGKRYGNQLVALAQKVDPSVRNSRANRSPGIPPTPAAMPPPAPSSTPTGGVTGLTAPAAPSRNSRAIRDLSRPGDTPGTSGDFDADNARITRLQKAYMGAGADTTTLHSRGGRWSKAREAEQQAVIDHFLNAPGVKADRKLLVLAGLPGAGKTTTINSPAGQQALGIDLSEYVTVNADEVKEQMVARGMVPDYPGLTPDESATLFHAESFEIAHALMRQAAKGGKNFAYDTSLKSTGQLGFATQAGSRQSPPPYEVTTVLVDVPVGTAKARAKARYLAGGRFMPLGLIDGMRGFGKRNSAPAENFDRIKGSSDRWFVFDNDGAAPVLTGSGGKPSRLARVASAASRAGAMQAPAVPAAVPAAVPSVAPQIAPVAAAPAIPAPSSVPSAVPFAGPAVPAGFPTPPAGALVYSHPQGKHAYVLPDGSMQVYKPGGKKATSSATPQKLAAGYGGWTEVLPTAGAPSAVPGTVQPLPAATTPLVAAPARPLQVSAGAPAPSGSLPVAPMDFGEADLSQVPKFIADPDYVFQQKVDGIRGVLVVEPGKAPWFASKKGDRLVSSTAAGVTTPMLAKMPATPAGSPAYRVEGEILNGKFHVFDMVIVGGESTDYETRKRMADAWVESVAPAMPQVSTLPTATTAAEKQALWDKVLASGAEGVMMKRRDSPYTGGQRVTHTLKAKITATADVVVLERNRGGKDNAVFGMLRNGKVEEIGTVSTGGKDKALGQIGVGEVVELEYLWASPSGVLTQPRIVRKRPDKNPADATDVGMLRFVDKSVIALAAKHARLQLEFARLEVTGA